MGFNSGFKGLNVSDTQSKRVANQTYWIHY